MGNSITEFMERAIAESDFILMILTPRYKEHSETRIGGVSYEQSIISSNIYNRKLIPVLASGTWVTSTPLFARTKLGVDLSSEEHYKEGFEQLVGSLYRASHSTVQMSPSPEFIDNVVKNPTPEKLDFPSNNQSEENKAVIADLERFIIDTDDLVEVIKRGINHGNGRFCFIIGAGASRSSGIKSGQELAFEWLEWMDQHNVLSKRESQAAALYNAHELIHPYKDIVGAYEKGKRERKVPSDYYFDVYKLRFFNNENEGIEEIEALMENIVPGFSFSILAQILTRYGDKCNLVITPNFDSLIEDALFIYTSKKPLVISHEALASFAKNPLKKRPIVAKIHRGLFFEPLSNPKEMISLKGEWYDILFRLLELYTPIVIGYGGGDHSLMTLLKDDKLKFYQKLYWCSYNDDEINNKEIATIIKNKNLRFVRTEGFDSLMSKLGGALFLSDILSDSVEKRMKQQCDEWFSKYMLSYREAVKKQHHDMQVLIEAEQNALKGRISDSALSKWDYLQLGMEKQSTSEYDGALSDFSKAIELDPTFVTAFQSRANTYNKMGRYDKAEADRNRGQELLSDQKLNYKNNKPPAE